MKTGTIIAIAVFIGIILLIFLGIRHLTLSADRFYKAANNLEKMIYRGESVYKVYDEFKRVHNLAFEKNTNQRVRELGKMIEVKYNIELFAKRKQS